MSTAGSDRSTAPFGAYEPGVIVPPAADGGPPKRVAIFRWRGIFGLLAILLLIGGFLALFGERIVRVNLEQAASQSLGTEVDIGRLSINPSRTAVTLSGIAIADPFDSTRNLLDARVASVELELEPLLQQKIVIRNLTLDGLRSGATRPTPARRMAAGGFAPRAIEAVKAFRAQFQVPLLSLTPVDTIRAIALDPSQLQTVKRATALARLVDSAQGDLGDRVKRLPIRETLDSAQALVDRLKGKTPRTLGLAGARAAVSDIRRLNDRVDSVKRSIDALQRAARGGVDSVAASLRAVNDARVADYAFARGLLKLPTFDAPNIGPALFGGVSLDAVSQAMYWMTLAREYAPPGLLPRETPGPKRLRRAGTTVHFVTPATFPRFHLKRGDLSVALGDAAGFARGEYALRVADITTDPALVRRPMIARLQRKAAGSAVESIAVGAVLDHAAKVPRDEITIDAAGVQLPSFPLPAVPLRLALGRGTSSLALRVNGSALDGSFTLSAPRVSWTADTAGKRAMNTLESLVARVVTRVPEVTVKAGVGGTMTRPSLSVSSNLDRAVADGIRSVAGEEITRAEGRIRAQVDSLAEEKVAPLRARVTALQAEADQRLNEARAKLDDAKARLAEQLKAMSAGLLGGP